MFQNQNVIKMNILILKRKNVWKKINVNQMNILMKKKENVKKNQKENEIFNNVNLIKNVYYQVYIMMIN